MIRGAMRRGARFLCACAFMAGAASACGSQVLPAASGTLPASATPGSVSVAPATVTTSATSATPEASPTTSNTIASATPLSITSASPSASSSPFATGSATPTLAPQQPGASRAQREIDRLLAVLRASPDNGRAYRDLGVAMIQRVRETGDPGLYTKADEAFAKARSLLPDDPLVLIGIGTLQLARHQFAGALATGRLVLKAQPFFPVARAIEVDALYSRFGLRVWEGLARAS